MPWEKSLLGRGNCQCKGPEVSMCFVVSGTKRRPGRLQQKEGWEWWEKQAGPVNCREEFGFYSDINSSRGRHDAINTLKEHFRV